MSNWSKQKTSPENLNGGQEYTDDSDITLDTFNVANNNAFYAVEVAEGVDGKAQNAVNVAKGAERTANGVDDKASKALETANNVKNSFNDILVTKGAGTQVLEGDVVQGKWNADTRMKIGLSVPNSDLNDAIQTGFYQGFSTPANLPPITPIDVPHFCMMVYYNIFGVVQVFYNMRTNQEIFFRITLGNLKEWSKWQKISTTTPEQTNVLSEGI